MKNNGQIFSLDLIFATILIILFIGILINITEVNNYQTKENILKSEFYLRGQTAINLLTHGEFSCDFEEMKLGNSLNKSKFISTEYTKLPEKLGLIDVNFEIYLNNNKSKWVGEITGDNVLVFSLDVLTCDNSNNPVDINSIKACLKNQEDDCSIRKENIVLKVSK